MAPSTRSAAISATRGLADLGGRSPAGRGDNPGDHRPPWRPLDIVRRRVCRVRAGSPPSWGIRESPTAAVPAECGPDAQAFDRDLPASQRGGAAIDSFRPVDRDRGRRCPYSLSTATAPIQGGMGNALHHGGTILDGRPARLPRRRQDATALGRRARASRDGAGDHRASCRNRPRRASKDHWIPAEDEGTSGGTVAGTPEVSHLL